MPAAKPPVDLFICLHLPSANLVDQTRPEKYGCLHLPFIQASAALASPVVKASAASAIEWLNAV